MASFIITIFFFFFITMMSTATSSSSSSTSTISVYELLPKFGLPSGLLPNTVRNYSVSEDDSGGFVVELESNCYVEFEYKVYYEKKITGKLGYGSITELKGIQVQRFYYLWFDVDEIKVDLPPSDSIYFKVGLINKRLDINQFKTLHSCSASKYSFLQLPTPLNEPQMMLVTE